MKAVYYQEFGPPEVLQIGERPVPAPGEGQVLVKVAAAAVNPIDRRLRAGELKGYFEREFPIIPGWDVAGRIEALGPGVTGCEVGDGVAALAFTWFLHHGAYAEYVPVGVESIAQKPAGITFVEAAALPLTSLTAWQALVEYGGLDRGQTAMIEAGAGGLGSAAISIAKYRGAKVYTTARPHNHDYLKKRGADRPIDYTREKPLDVIRAEEPGGVDVVLASLEDQEAIEAAIHMVKEGGVVAYMNNDPPDIPEVSAKNVKTEFLHHRPDGAMLADLLALYASGKLDLPEIETIALEDAVEAHRRSESWQTRGKLVFEIDPTL